MDKDKGYTQQEYDCVYGWCDKYMLGEAKARHRENILSFMPVNITDRKFRKIFNAIGPAQGFYSSSSRGYWVCPPVTTAINEINAVLDALHERRAKAISTIKGLEPYIKEFETRKQQERMLV